MRKFILIHFYTGFGNKIFDSIIALYIKYNFNYDIYFTNTIGPHYENYLINQIFPELSKEINFINENQSKNIQKIITNPILHIRTNSISNLKSFFISDKIRLKTSLLYKFVFDMYKTFDSKIKDIYSINEKILTKQLLYHKNYATIHIRYGDKLFLAIKKNNCDKYLKFPIFTPEYYYEQIINIKKLNLPIFILTDSPKIINHFLIKKYNIQKDVVLKNFSFIDSFYLMLKSNLSVLSQSTFSFSSYLLSNNNNKKYIFCSIPEYSPKTFDYLLSNEWTIHNNKKYILNFNQKLVKEMCNYISLSNDG